MKINFPILLINVLCILISSCAPSKIPIRPTTTPRHRPLSEYDVGKWHSEIALRMMEKGSTILKNVGEGEIDFEIEILPASSLEDEIIILKYGNWPEDAELGQVWLWLFLTIVTESKRYELDPQAVIAAQFKNKPYGEFMAENNNILGFCKIPWHSVTTYTSSGGHDASDVKQFIDSWQCSFR